MESLITTILILKTAFYLLNQKPDFDQMGTEIHHWEDLKMIIDFGNLNPISGPRMFYLSKSKSDKKRGLPDPVFIPHMLKSALHATFLDFRFFSRVVLCLKFTSG